MGSLPSMAAKQSRKYVAVFCGPYLLISVYILPNLGLNDFDTTLGEISEVISRVNELIVGDDFNAKSVLWGVRNTNGRGRLLASWAAERDLRVANVGNRPTCVRPQGTSNRKFDSDFFRAVLIWKGQEPDVEDRMDVEQMASWVGRIMVEACDAAAPRIGPKKPRRQAYWWQDSVALIRRECIRAHRFWQREKRKNRPQPDVVVALGKVYKERRKELRNEISRLKSLVWQELINSIDGDPWGIPYKLVMKNLKTATPGMSKLLEPEILSNLLDSLFPRRGAPDPIEDWRDFTWSED
ncbi:reverse transcrpitase [Lasius niger]|uniref:Reverse transcrpitase n=1 Tax=Lasius niger TaxID=67767 RepID=A0A0J7JWT7_LASNI|nr:reverse transcrpitase [Lasius niger]